VIWSMAATNPTGFVMGVLSPISGSYSDLP